MAARDQRIEPGRWHREIATRIIHSDTFSAVSKAKYVRSSLDPISTFHDPPGLGEDGRQRIARISSASPISPASFSSSTSETTSATWADTVNRKTGRGSVHSAKNCAPSGMRSFGRWRFSRTLRHRPSSPRNKQNACHPNKPPHRGMGRHKNQTRPSGQADAEPGRDAGHHPVLRVGERHNQPTGQLSSDLTAQTTNEINANKPISPKIIQGRQGLFRCSNYPFLHV